jgi:hypothetical protein
MDSAIAQVDQLDADSGTTLKLADWRVTGEMFSVKGSRLAWVQGKAVMDAAMWHCAAYHVLVLSRASVKSFKDFSGGGGQERNVVELNRHSFIYQMVVDHKIPGFGPRESVWLCVGRTESAEAVEVTIVPHTCDEFPLRPQFVRGLCTLVVRLEKLPPLEGGIPQTRVTYTQQMDAGGRLPSKLVNRFAAAQLSPLSTMRVRLDQSEKIDGDKRLEIVKKIEAHGARSSSEGGLSESVLRAQSTSSLYSSEELKIIEDGLAVFEIFKGKKGKLIKLPNPLTTAKVARKERESKVYGWASTTVRAR